MLKKFANRLGLMTKEQAETMARYAAAEAEKAAREKLPEIALAYAHAHEYDVPSAESYQYQADIMGKIAYLYTAVMLTANSASSQDFDVYENGEEIENSDLELLLKAPNPNQTGFEFLRDHFAYKLLNGGCYWWLNSTSPTAAPAELWIIPPGNIEPVPDEKLGISHYNYLPGDGTVIELPTWQVVWFRGFHPSNQYASMSALVPLKSTMITDIETQNYLRTVYGPNSGRLPGIIAFKSPISDPDWKQIKKDVVKSSEEKTYMMLRGVGDGVTWLQAAATINEMQVYQGRAMTKTDIFNAIAPGLINMTSENATEANAVTGKATFAEFTLYPMLIDTTQKINKDLAWRFGEGITIEFDDPRDLKASADAAAMALETQRASVFTSYSQKLPASVAAKLAGIELPFGLRYAQLDGMTQGQLSQATIPISAPAAQPQLPAPADSPAALQADAVAAELMKWQRYEVNHFGQKCAPFDARKIPPLMALNIAQALKAVTQVEEFPAIFATAGQTIPALILADAINRAQ